MSSHIGNKGIYAIDRGGDRGKPYDKFLEKKKEKRFVIRLAKTRDLTYKGTRKNCHDMALTLAVSYFAAVYLGDNLRLKVLDGLYALLFSDKTGMQTSIKKTSKTEFQLAFSFGRKTGETPVKISLDKLNS